jgi:putative transposase
LSLSREASDKDSYLLELARYIVLNPVRAQMVRTAVDWPWSGYRATVGLEQPSVGTYVDWLLAAFGDQRAHTIDAFEQFVAAGNGQPSPWQG